MSNDLKVDAAGRPLITLNPAEARLKLAELEASPDYLDILQDVRHPLHSYRTAERKGLQIVAASRKP